MLDIAPNQKQCKILSQRQSIHTRKPVPSCIRVGNVWQRQQQHQGNWLYAKKQLDKTATSNIFKNHARIQQIPEYLPLGVYFLQQVHVQPIWLWLVSTRCTPKACNHQRFATLQVLAPLDASIGKTHLATDLHIAIPSGWHCDERFFLSKPPLKSKVLLIGLTEKLGDIRHTATAELIH